MGGQGRPLQTLPAPGRVQANRHLTAKQRSPVTATASERKDRTSPVRDPGQCLPDGQLALVLFALLATAYLLTFSGEFSSIDELAMYASTESLS